MDTFKVYLYSILNGILLFIILFKWINFRIFNHNKHSFSDSFYYKNYDIINSRNSSSKKNKIIQNYLSLFFVCVFFIEIILILLFKFL